MIMSLELIFMHACVLPEHLVQFIGGHAAAIIGDSQTEPAAFLHDIYPDLFGTYPRI